MSVITEWDVILLQCKAVYSIYLGKNVDTIPGSFVKSDRQYLGFNFKLNRFLPVDYRNLFLYTYNFYSYLRTESEKI